MDILEIIKEMKSLPKGTLVYKKIKGKDQPYLQWTENGKTKSRYIKIEEREKVISQLERRKYLKESFDRITEDLAKGDDLFYVADNMVEYNAVKQEQPLISKKEIRSGFSVERNYINSKAYHDKFIKLPLSKTVYERVYVESGRLLEEVDGTNIEKMIAISARTGNLIVDNFDREGKAEHTSFNKKEYSFIEKSEDLIIVLHNHSYNRPPSGRDLATYAESDKIKISIILCHDGDVYAILSAVPEVAEIYMMYYDELKDKFGDENARVIATGRLEKLNINNKLYEVRRL